MERIPLPRDVWFQIDGYRLHARQIIELLSPFITETRRARIARVVQHRTYTVTPVIEGLYDLGNVSAVMRTAEGLGYQPFHLIEHGTKFKKANRVSAGAEKWLDIYRWKHTSEAIHYLKEQGYRILATYLDEQARPIQDFDFTQPTALLFGNEHEGLSMEAVALSDATCMIPMYGFVQSFNISVAAAISLYHAQQDRLRRQGYHGDLTPEEQLILTAEFYLRSIRQPERLLRELLARHSSPSGV